MMIGVVGREVGRGLVIVGVGFGEPVMIGEGEPVMIGDGESVMIGDGRVGGCRVGTDGIGDGEIGAERVGLGVADWSGSGACVGRMVTGLVGRTVGVGEGRVGAGVHCGGWPPGVGSPEADGLWVGCGLPLPGLVLVGDGLPGVGLVLVGDGLPGVGLALVDSQGRPGGQRGTSAAARVGPQPNKAALNAAPSQRVVRRSLRTVSPLIHPPGARYANNKQSAAWLSAQRGCASTWPVRVDGGHSTNTPNQDWFGV